MLSVFFFKKFFSLTPLPVPAPLLLLIVVAAVRRFLGNFKNLGGWHEQFFCPELISPPTGNNPGGCPRSRRPSMAGRVHHRCSIVAMAGYSSVAAIVAMAG